MKSIYSASRPLMREVVPPRLLGKFGVGVELWLRLHGLTGAAAKNFFFLQTM